MRQVDVSEKFPGRVVPFRSMLIDGKWVASADGTSIVIENPANREVLANVPSAKSEDVDLAVKSAGRAFIGWSRQMPRDRGRLLLRIADAIEANLEALAQTLAQETGNAIRPQARPEIEDTADLFRYFGGLASELKGHTIPISEQVLSYTRREPLGVVGAIIPWNAPVIIAASKIAPALCAGNTLVLKAAEDAPLAVLQLAELCQSFLPDGVLNVLTGTGEQCGAALAQHPGISKLSFTGSTDVGKLILRSASDRVIPVSLELGGKSPSIVFPDANAAWVVDGVMSAMRFTRQSQSCTAGSRLFLHASIVDSFTEQLVAKVRTLKIGDPMSDASDIGSLINRKQFEKVCSYIDEGTERSSARLLTGGRISASNPELNAGYFAQPTIFVESSNNWRLAREEIFGPVLVVIPWRDESEVLRMANDTHYGLAAYIWTQDIQRGLRTAHDVDAGWVQVNRGGGQYPGQPYGGFKQSGIGHEGSLESMLDSFTRLKSVTVNIDTPRQGEVGMKPSTSSEQPTE